jgi:hypothetical protein
MLRIRDLAQARPRFGYLRMWVLLRREGWLVNRKRVRRLYRLEPIRSCNPSGQVLSGDAPPRSILVDHGKEFQ